MKKKDLALDLLDMALARKHEPAALSTTLIAIDRMVKQRPDHALSHYASGRVLMLLGSYQLALGALRTATECDNTLFEAHYFEGVCHWMLGYDEKAVEKLEHAVLLDDSRFEPFHDAGQIFANRAEHVRAYRCFQLAYERARQDFGVVKKLLQAEIRLDLWEDARDRHGELRRLRASSPDPLVRQLKSFVLDQFEVGEHAVLAIETFEPTGDPCVLLNFAVTLHGTLSFSVNLESSVALRAADIAWVLVVQEGDVRIHTAFNYASRPPYPDLREDVRNLIERWTVPE